MNLSGQINFGKKDKFIYQDFTVRGLARYRSGSYAAPDSTGKLEAITGIGFTGRCIAPLVHAWSSCVMYNYGTDEPPDLQNRSDSKHQLRGGEPALALCFVRMGRCGIPAWHQ